MARDYQLSRDITGFIVEIIVISVKPYGPEVVGKEGIPGKPAIKGFPLELLPSYLPISVRYSRLDLDRFELSYMKDFSPKQSDIRVFEENVVNSFFLILA